MDFVSAALLFVGGVAISCIVWSLYMLWRVFFSVQSKRFNQRLEALTEFSQRDRSTLLKEHLLSEWPWLDDKLKLWPPALRIDSFLKRSGTPFTVSDTLVASLMAGVITFVLTCILSSSVLAALIGLVMGGSIPWLILRMVTHRRQAILEAQLPDVLDFIARSMQAGHAFNGALQMAASESPEPIASEFLRTFNQINVGGAVQDAMASLADRIDCTDMRYFAVSVVINREVGGDLAELLRNVAGLIRERLRLRLRIRVLTSEARASAWVLGVLPFVLAGILFSLDPDYLSPLWTDASGRKMLAYTLFLMVIGIFWMNRLSKVRP